MKVKSYTGAMVISLHCKHNMFTYISVSHKHTAKNCTFSQFHTNIYSVFLDTFHVLDPAAKNWSVQGTIVYYGFFVSYQLLLLINGYNTLFWLYIKFVFLPFLPHTIAILVDICVPLSKDSSLSFLHVMIHSSGITP